MAWANILMWSIKDSNWCTGLLWELNLVMCTMYREKCMSHNKCSLNVFIAKCCDMWCNENATWIWRRKASPRVRRVEGRVHEGGKTSAVGLLSGVGSYKVLGAP